MRRLLLTLLIATWLPGAVAHAGYHQFNVDDVAKFDILSGWRTKTGAHMAALRVTLAPGWKTYWRAPGEGGIPPRFDWAQSRNLHAVRFHWPAPEVFEQNGMRSIGYRHELILPIELTPRQKGQAIAMRATVEIGVCEEICIPVMVDISADIAGPGAMDPRIKAAINARPQAAKAAGIRQVRCQIDPIADGLRLTAQIAMPKMGGSEVAIFELPDQTIWVAEAATQRRGNVLTAVTEMVPANNRPFSLDRSTVRITLLGGGRAIDIQGCSG